MSLCLCGLAVGAAHRGQCDCLGADESVVLLSKAECDGYMS
eukprot:CAMPEP_0183335716 /NCGR_PEP_ID=MMETSP0164_2-20130417/3927_1 /TAXON_ID=221442 /ORGANISM="Coccolithus pelagicus ssp braarudi, Strain PLY182g" /LENGTH=40 /DNA_ID= /DNA_START= /DNA_END= /DNA_ORIENTATION=